MSDGVLVSVDLAWLDEAAAVGLEVVVSELVLSEVVVSEVSDCFSVLHTMSQYPFSARISVIARRHSW